MEHFLACHEHAFAAFGGVPSKILAHTPQPAVLQRLDRAAPCVASSQFRITLDTNHYSVPASYAHRRVTVKAWPDRVCIYFDNQFIARHARRYGRHLDIEDADHAKALVAQRSHAREQRL